MGKYRTPGVLYPSSLATCLTLLQACSGIGAVSGDTQLKVESDPAGATIYIMGKAMGETPLTISQQQLYPPGYDAGRQRMYGSLLFSKEGCEELTKRVHYRDFDSGLSVELDCKQPTAPSTSQPDDELSGLSEKADGAVELEGASPGVSVKQPIHATERAINGGQSAQLTIKQRLMRIDSLKREGMISEEEYSQARERILDAL